jgi:RNA polymerase sigma factor (sigma-70 family)
VRLAGPVHYGSTLRLRQVQIVPKRGIEKIFPPLIRLYLQMNQLPVTERPSAVEAERISEAMSLEGRRLRRWIQRNVADRHEVEDILQDVFFELVQAHRLLQPIEDVGAWLFRVARNRVIDLVRKKRPQALADQVPVAAEDAGSSIEDLMPSADAGPGAAYARDWFIDELEDALEELPAEQREVFLAHEISGLSFREIADLTGVGVNTLISRKHYAVLQLRRRLQAVHDEFLRE